MSQTFCWWSFFCAFPLALFLYTLFLYTVSLYALSHFTHSLTLRTHSLSLMAHSLSVLFLPTHTHTHTYSGTMSNAQIVDVLTDPIVSKHLICISTHLGWSLKSWNLTIVSSTGKLIVNISDRLSLKVKLEEFVFSLRLIFRKKYNNIQRTKSLLQLVICRFYRFPSIKADNRFRSHLYKRIIYAIF